MCPASFFQGNTCTVRLCSGFLSAEFDARSLARKLSIHPILRLVERCFVLQRLQLDLLLLLLQRIGLSCALVLYLQPPLLALLPLHIQTHRYCLLFFVAL